MFQQLNPSAVLTPIVLQVGKSSSLTVVGATVYKCTAGLVHDFKFKTFGGHRLACVAVFGFSKCPSGIHDSSGCWVA